MQPKMQSNLAYKLPDFIRKSSLLSFFKTNLKTYLFKLYYD